mgnify:CR=1 FL=1
MRKKIVRMVRIRKTFGAVRALWDVDFDVGYGEIVGLLGDNGAGKSTLIKILSGVYKPDSGDIYFEEKKISLRHPAEARALGIETVQQGLNVFELMDLTRNLFIGREKVKRVGVLRFLDHRSMKDEACRMIVSIGIKRANPDVPAGVLSGGERQAINIGRAMYFQAKVVILDEPTTALSVKETERVLRFIEQVRQRGSSVIFVTHNVYHVYEVADRFVILDRGVKIAELSREEATPDEIIALIRAGKLSGVPHQEEELGGRCQPWNRGTGF